MKEKQALKEINSKEYELSPMVAIGILQIVIGCIALFSYQVTHESKLLLIGSLVATGLITLLIKKDK